MTESADQSWRGKRVSDMTDDVIRAMAGIDLTGLPAEQATKLGAMHGDLLAERDQLRERLASAHDALTMAADNLPDPQGPDAGSKGKTLADMTAEVRAINVERGWRTGDNTFGDYIALLHSELSEALEAYRDHRLDDATGPNHQFLNDGAGCCQICEDPDHNGPFKPEGVGSELADMLIRLLDTCDVYGIDLAAEYERKIAFNRTRPYQHGGRTLADSGRVSGRG